MAFCLRPHDAFAARMKITMFTFREKERVCEQNCNGLKTFSFSLDYFNSCTYQDDHKDGSCKAPDERVVDGEPAEVRVPVTLRVKADCQT